MKKVLTMFALTGIMAGCANKNNQSDIRDSSIVTLHDQKVQKELNDQKIQKELALKLTPCIIEVPCNEPELVIPPNDPHSDGKSGHENLRKFYNFCDSTTTITWWSKNTHGIVYDHETRPITELHGTERQEMEAAYAKYQQSLKM